MSTWSRRSLLGVGIPMPRCAGTLVLAVASLLGCGEGGGDSAGSDAKAVEPGPPDLVGSTTAGIEAGETAAWFVDDAEASGLDFELETRLGSGPMLPEIVSGGGAAADFDGDGRLDLYLVQGTGAGGNRLFRNLDGRRFEDVTDRGEASDAGRFGMGVVSGDYDGDGDIDLYVSNLGRDTLLRNDGDFRFTDVTDAAGLGDEGFAASATFFDGDLDGDLDLFVTRYVDWDPAEEMDCRQPSGAPDYCAPAQYDRPTTDLLYRNEGDGRFVDVSEESGIAGSVGTGLGVAFLKANDDDLPDLFVANDGMPDHLWINRGGLRFSEEAVRSGCDRDLSGVAKAGMGVAIEDVDDDGDWDILVCNLGGETDSLHLNEGGRFVDGTARSGLGAATRRYTRFGLGLVDFDRDGRLDLFAANGRVGVGGTVHDPADPYAEPDLLLLGDDRGRFGRVSAAGPAIREARTSRGAVFGDFDDDGGVDIVVIDREAPVRLLRNTVPADDAWAIFDVRGPSGGPAIGAEVVAELGDRTLRRTIRSDGSYLSSRDPRAHFGLGGLEAIPAVTIRWPDGEVVRLLDQPVRGVVRVDHPGEVIGEPVGADPRKDR